MERKYVLGIDIGGTSIKIGIISGSYLVESFTIRNNFKGKCNLFVAGIKPTIDSFIERYHITKIGIGCPGEIQNGVVLLASNLGWVNYNIKEDFQNNYPGMEIVVDNDGNAACLAEKKYGLLKGKDNGIYITLGKGVGGAIIINNKIMMGNHGMGGRFGHMVIKENGRHCACGRRGCFEIYGSITGLILTVREVNNRQQDESKKIDLSKISGYQIVKYVIDGNETVIEAVKRWNNDLAEGILNLCMIFDIDDIVIGGGITESGLIDIPFIKSKLAPFGYEKCNLSISTFKGKTGLIGAAALVQDD